MRTGGNKSSSRIQSIRETWGKDLEEGSLDLLQPDDTCKRVYGDNHWKGLTCLEATNEARLMNRTDFEWLLVVDDDVFVFADRLRDTLRHMDPSKAAVYGVPMCGDCGKQDGRRGLCGGGGYILSRQSLLQMAGLTEGPVPDDQGRSFVDHMLSPPSSEWCDLRFGCVAHEMGLKVVDVKGLYGNGFFDKDGKPDIEEEGKVVSLMSQDAPLVFHEVRDHDHMKRLYDQSLEVRERMKGVATEYNEAGSDGLEKWASIYR